MVSAGEGQKGSDVKVGEESFSSESLEEEDIGTPVDEFIDPESINKSFAESRSVKQPVEKPEKVSLSGNIPGLDRLAEEFKAPLATPESISKHAKIKGKSDASVTEESDKPKIDESNTAENDDSNVPEENEADALEDDGQSTEKEDRLAKIAQQIDDFDPSSLYGSSNSQKDNEEEAMFSKDINDETLIDDLIKDSENDASLGDSNENDKGQIGEITPEQGNDGGLDVDKTTDSGSISTVESNENLDKTSNGSMSASTESDGFQDGMNGDDQESKEEKPNTLEDENNATDSQPAEDKTATQKGENVSPSKTGKSKKKEDKSIGNQFYFKTFRIISG